MILENSSPYFLFKNCKFANEKGKRNCARLGIYRDFNIWDTYTIESSCWGYEIKGTGNPDEDEEPEVDSFTMQHFLEFGEHLVFSICKHLAVEVTELDRAGMVWGFDIEKDFCLGREDFDDKKSPNKKKSQKPRRRNESASKDGNSADTTADDLRQSQLLSSKQKFRTDSNGPEVNKKLTQSHQKLTMSQNSTMNEIIAKRQREINSQQKNPDPKELDHPIERVNSN